MIIDSKRLSPGFFELKLNPHKRSPLLKQLLVEVFMRNGSFANEFQSSTISGRKKFWYNDIQQTGVEHQWINTTPHYNSKLYFYITTLYGLIILCISLQITITSCLDEKAKCSYSPCALSLGYGFTLWWCSSF